ncbi:MAG: alpha/beta hydrolase [Bacillus sp. (in: Bacteria)]|nr:alpha/beta hydrolase [Bacillus sp. (in: firmicutes)]
MNDFSISQEIIRVGNVDIYCEYVLNEKPPIFLIHGFVSSTYTFHRIIPLLARHFSVFAIDLPGFGRSEKSTTFQYTFQNYGKVVLECFHYFNLQEVTLVGHSMGGQIALNTAKIEPNKIKKLILLCSSGYLRRAKRTLIYSSYIPFFSYFVEKYIKMKKVEDYLKNVLYDHNLINDDLLREFGRPLGDRNFYKALVRLLRYREGDLSSEQLKKNPYTSIAYLGRRR